MLTMTAQLVIDGTSEGDRERAHAFIDAVFAANGTVDVAAGAAQGAGEGGWAERKELAPDELRQLLRQLADGEIGRPLNPGERTMLLGIAERSPQPLDYDANRALLGTGAKFGNVSSGLARRFWNRGYELPYKEGAGGYVMEEAVAAVVREVLAPEVV